MRDRLNIYLPPEVHGQLSDLSLRKRISKSALIETAVVAFLSPESSDQFEAALTRRLDRLTRQSQRVERNLAISFEMLALFIRFYLKVAPQIPADASPAAQAIGSERFNSFLDSLTQRLQSRHSFLREICDDVERHEPEDPAPRS